MEPSVVERLVIDDPTAGLFRVNRRVFTCPQVLELEKARIFAHCL